MSEVVKECLAWDEIVAMVAAGEVTIKEAGERFDGVVYDGEENVLVDERLSHLLWFGNEIFDEGFWLQENLDEKTVEKWVSDFDWTWINYDSTLSISGKLEFSVWQEQIDSDGNEADRHKVFSYEIFLCDILDHDFLIRPIADRRYACCGCREIDHEWVDERSIARQGTSETTRCSCENCGLVKIRHEMGYQDDGKVGAVVRYEWDESFVAEDEEEDDSEIA